MNTIKVYHGSYCKVSTPTLENGRMDADFGIGFYVTTDITMAEKWACRKKKPIINEYTLNLKDLEKYSFGLDGQWLDFVIQNRNAVATDFSVNKYDLLIGVTADDKLFATIEQYESGFIDEETAVEVLNCMNVGTQICIRTEKGLNNLHFDKIIELTPERVNEIREINKADRILANQRTRETIQSRNQKTCVGQPKNRAIGKEMSDYKAIIMKWKSKNICTVDDLQIALNNFKVIFAFHSGVIENPEISYHNTREIFENGKVINFTGDLRTIYEIENQKKCYEFLKEKIVAREKITPELIKEIHKKLMSGTYDETRWRKGERPGQHKVNDYSVADGQGTLPEEVAREIEELCEELEEIPDKGENILRAAAYVHCKLENIHPFADGNGRVGRTLMNYFLMINNCPPVVVHNETKDKYYKALGHYDKTGEVEKFTDYIKMELEKTWKPEPVVKRGLEGFLER